MIPFLDLPAQHLALEKELMDVFQNALRNAAFIGGPEVEAFEDEFARFCDAKYCVGVNSGTDALRFALIAAGIGANDMVITVPNTFIATTEAITQVGARPVFIDIDEKTYNLDPQKLSDYLDGCAPGIVDRIKAVVPVHLYGQPADMDALLELGEKYGFIVIEDACQAHGAKYLSRKENRWRQAGSLGSAAAFSFYPGKNLGACGEGGAITTNNEEIATTAKILRDHGQAKKYYHDLEGYNGRLDAIQAGFLRVKLRHLDTWTESRQKNAQLYNALLENVDGIITPYEPSWTKAVYHLYIIRTADRHALQDFLAKSNIATGLHYPLPLHLQKAYEGLGYKEGDFPVAERLAKEILSLPMFPELTSDQIKLVCDKIKEFSSQ